jgi:hypothetical protein
MGPAIAMGVVLLGVLAITGVLVGALVLSISRDRRTTSPRDVWRNYGLSIAFAALFFFSWILQLITEWQVFVDEQRAHGESTGIGDFIAEFSQATLENWQSEFLQLFSFTLLAALLIHKGSAESKDSDEEMQQALARIEQRLEDSRT